MVPHMTALEAVPFRLSDQPAEPEIVATSAAGATASRRGRPAMTIEVLYFDGCPSYEALVPHLQQLLSERGVAADVALRRVDSDADAQRLRFLGSPTVRVDGRDVEPGADARTTLA